MKYYLNGIGNIHVDKPEFIAMITGNIELVKDYIEKGWNVNDEHTLNDENICNQVIPLPIMLPVVQNDYQMVELLIKNKAKLDYKKKHIMTYALDYSDEKMIRLLLNNGAKLKCHYGETEIDILEKLYSVSENKDFVKYYQLLCEYDDSIKRNSGIILRKAILKHDDRVVEYLLNTNVDINCDKYNVVDGNATPLSSAIIFNELLYIKALVDKGVEIFLKREKRYAYEYSLDVLFEHKNFEIVKYLKKFAPKEISNIENMIYEAEFPKELIEKLKSDDRIISFANRGKKYDIELMAWEDLCKVKIKKTFYICLSDFVDVPLYSSFILVWNHKKKRIKMCSEYHDIDICTYEKILEKPEIINEFLYNKIY